MLVISRKREQAIAIQGPGCSIAVGIVKPGPLQAKLAILAPGCLVRRAELDKQQRQPPAAKSTGRLLLTRHLEQAIEIQPPGQQPITVKVVRLGGGSCKLGISAPAGFSILRGELVQLQNRTQGQADGRPEAAVSA